MERILTIRLPEELYKKLEEYATSTGRPLSNAARFMIEKYLQATDELGVN